jgi:hypothetical protein
MILAVCIGILGGFIAGLLGIGSGIILVPCIILLMNANFRVATACSLFAIAVLSPLGAYEHHKHGNLSVKSGITLGAFGFIGSIIGVVLAAWLPTTMLQIFLGVALILTAVRIFVSVGKAHHVRNSIRTTARPYILPIIGVFAGMIAGMLGIGGGIIMVPGMMFIGYSVHTAIGTSLFAIVFNAIGGVVTHALYHHLLLGVAIPLAVGTILGVKYGADTASKLKPRKLSIVFSIALIIIGSYLILTGIFY